MISFYYRWLHLKHFWPFYWAHKPLCHEYSQKIIKLKKLNICRSCFFLWGSFSIGIIGLVTFKFPWHETMLLPLVIVIVFGNELVYPKLKRFYQDFHRSFLGLEISLILYYLIALEPFSILSGFILLLFLIINYKSRKKRKLNECFSCHEYGKGKVCSGYKLWANAHKDFEQEYYKKVLINKKPKGAKDYA